MLNFGMNEIPKYFIKQWPKLRRKQLILRFMPFVSFLLVGIVGYMLGRYAVTNEPSPEKPGVVAAWVVFSLGILTLTISTRVVMDEAQEYLADFSVFISEMEEFFSPYGMTTKKLTDQETLEPFSETRLWRCAWHRLQTLGDVLCSVEHVYNTMKPNDPERKSAEIAKILVKAQFERAFDQAKKGKVILENTTYRDFLGKRPRDSYVPPEDQVELV